MTKTIVSKRKRSAFLKALSLTGQVVESARAAGYTDSSYLRKLYNADEDFAESWEEALISASDSIEDACITRARDGVNEAVYYKGEVVGQKLRYSDQLAMFLLKGMRPEKYRDTLNVNGRLEGTFGVAVLPMTAVDVGTWEETAAQLHSAQTTLVLPGDPTLIIEQREKESILEKVESKPSLVNEGVVRV